MNTDYECNSCGKTVDVKELMEDIRKIRKEGWILREDELHEKRNLKNLRHTYIKCDKCNRGVFFKK